MPEAVASPCINVCRMENGLCAGCHRTIDEIARWANIGDEGKRLILTWLDDCTRYAIRVTAHHRVTTPIVLAEFRAAVRTVGIPASTLTDNGMVFTVRLAASDAKADATPSRTSSADCT